MFYAYKDKEKETKMVCFLFLLAFFLSSFLFPPENIYAKTGVLLEEDFEDNKVEGWIEYPGGKEKNYHWEIKEDPENP